MVQRLVLYIKLKSSLHPAHIGKPNDGTASLSQSQAVVRAASRCQMAWASSDCLTDSRVHRFFTLWLAVAGRRSKSIEIGTPRSIARSPSTPGSVTSNGSVSSTEPSDQWHFADMTRVAVATLTLGVEWLMEAAPECRCLTVCCIQPREVEVIAS